MSLLDKIIKLLKPTSPNTFETVSDKKVEPSIEGEQEIFIGPLISRIKFSVKYTTTMINTLTLSSDMKTLFLIDNGRAVSFPIDTENGVLIGSFKGQIAVATALTQEEEEEGAATPPEPEGRMPGKQVIITVGIATKQWTLTYNKRSGIMSIIGATEIDSSLRTEPNCEEHRVNLNDSVVKIKRKGEEIILTVFDR